MANAPKNLESPKTENPPSSNPFITARDELKAFICDNSGYLHLNFFTLFWLFLLGSIFGLIVETIYHAIVFGGLESRAGLVWGPFSPIYGVGAVVLTFFLNRYYHSHNLIIFFVSMLLGTIIEYAASWGMEVFWNTIAWDYTGTFGNIQGRTNFYFGILWGLLGLVWVRIMLPLIKQISEKVDSENKIFRGLTFVLTIFMIVNIACTFLALDRQKERAAEIPAQNQIQIICDEVFPDEFLQARFQNMSLR